MSRFSERQGLKSVRRALQLEDIDDELRNGIWSTLQVHYWDSVRIKGGVYPGYYLSSNAKMERLCKSLWYSFFKRPLDTLDNDWKTVSSELRGFFFDAQWYEVYDFTEFVVQHYPDRRANEQFSLALNGLLEREVAGYRLIGDVIAPIDSEAELSAIGEALEEHGGVGMHLKRSLELLASRDSPDYRNSIKESISAVEAVCRELVGSKDVTLGEALRELERQQSLHPALKKAFSSLYGYTSDKGGIRHALLEEDSVSFAEAKFMLVACSGFVSFARTVAAEREST